MPMSTEARPALILFTIIDACQGLFESEGSTGTYLSPTALVATEDGKTLYVAGATAKQVLGSPAQRQVQASAPESNFLSVSYQYST